MKLNNRQKLFLKYLSQGSNYKQAMLKAGYSKTTAKRGVDGVFNRESIQAHQLSDKEERLSIIQGFKDVIERSQIKSDRSNELRSLEALARINAMFTDKHELKQDHTITDKERSILDRYT